MLYGAAPAPPGQTGASARSVGCLAARPGDDLGFAMDLGADRQTASLAPREKSRAATVEKAVTAADAHVAELQTADLRIGDVQRPVRALHHERQPRGGAERA